MVEAVATQQCLELAQPTEIKMQISAEETSDVQQTAVKELKNALGTFLYFPSEEEFIRYTSAPAQTHRDRVQWTDIVWNGVGWYYFYIFIRSAMLRPAEQWLVDRERLEVNTIKASQRILDQCQDLRVELFGAPRCDQE